MNEYKLDELDSKLRKLSDSQYENEKQLAQNNMIEREINEIFYRGNKIFYKLISMWYQDQEMNCFLDDVKKSVNRIERQTIMQLEDQKEVLYREKIDIEEKEYRYLNDRQNLLTKGD